MRTSLAPPWSFFSATLQDFLCKCLEMSVDKRADATELLKHDFIKKAAPLHSLIPMIKAAKQVR